MCTVHKTVHCLSCYMNIPKYSKLFIQIVRETSCPGFRETSVRESDCPGNVNYPFWKCHGKVIIYYSILGLYGLTISEMLAIFPVILYDCKEQWKLDGYIVWNDTIQYSARSARLSVRLSKWACPKMTSGQSNWHKTHRRRRRMVQCYSTGDGNVSSHESTLAPPGEYDWICVSFGPPKFTIQRANRPVKTLLHSSRQKVPIIYNGRAYAPELPLQMGIWTPV